MVRTADGRYLLAASLALGISTVIWSIVIARLQQGNADQLANGFLFTDANTFRHAQFPAQHTQLLKWPLFWLLGSLHNAAAAYSAVTAILSMVTVGALAYLLARIVLGQALLATLYVALTCVLMLIPAQVMGGVSSPLSMAMVSGRNVEYIVYIGALVLLLPKAKANEWLRWGMAAALFGLLFASDNMFLFYAVPGATMLLVYAYIRKRQVLRLLSLRWLAASGVGYLLAKSLLWTANLFTGIVSDPATSNGYNASLAAVHSAMTAGLKALLLNFGVSASAGRLAIVPALLNVLIIGLVVYACYVVGRRMVQSSVQADKSTLLAVLLGVSTLAAYIGYVTVSHPVTLDARYLTIALFAGFVALAVYGRTLHLHAVILHSMGGVLFVGSALGLVATVRHVDWTRVADPMYARNAQVAAVLSKRPEQMLIGDFWQVLPIKEQTKRARQQILPLSGCMRPRQILASSAWRQDLYTHSFAYLLPLTSSGMSFGRCSLRTAIVLYGPPSQIVRIGGTQKSPSELLLLYNDGAARIRGTRPGAPTPVFGVPTEGTAKPTGSTIVPLADPS